MLKKIIHFYKGYSMLKSYIGGVFGGLTIIAAFMLIIFSTNLFTYNVKINVASSTQDQVKETDKLKLLKELEKEKVIVSPQDFTGNVISYYNTALTIMAALLIIFSVISYVHLRFISRDQVSTVFKENVKDSVEFQKLLTETLFGKAEGKFASLDSVEDLKQEIAKINIEDFYNRLKIIEDKFSGGTATNDEIIEEK